MIGLARIVDGAVAAYPVSRSQALQIAKALMPEDVELHLPLDLTGVDLSEFGIFEVAEVAPPAAAEGEVVVELTPVHVGGGWRQKWTKRPMTAEELAATVPAVVTMRQARLALLAAGKLAGVEAALAGLPSPEREAAQIEWEYAAEVRRDNPIIALVAPALELDDAAIDALFVAAAAL